MSIFIGIEGVGMRRCAAVASDENGVVVGHAHLPYGLALHAMPREMLQSRLKNLLQKVAKSAGRDLNHLKDATICVGLTGVTFPYDAEVDLPREFDELRLDVENLICTGDAEIVMASHIHKDRGAALLCHMGSTAFVASGLTRTQRVRVGGWGPALGDEGSGYWIGRYALRLIGEQYDAKAAESPLWTEIVGWLKAPDPDIASWEDARLLWNRIHSDYQRKDGNDHRPAIFAFAHELSRRNQTDWRDVASGLAIPVMRAAFDGRDPGALKILDEAAQHLYSQLSEAFRVSGIAPRDTPIVLYGGVMTHNRRFRDMIVERLRARDQVEDVKSPDGPGTVRPVYGALLYALGKSTSEDLALPASRVIDRLLSDRTISRPPVGLFND